MSNNWSINLLCHAQAMTSLFLKFDDRVSFLFSSSCSWIKSKTSRKKKIKIQKFQGVIVNGQSVLVILFLIWVRDFCGECFLASLSSLAVSSRIPQCNNLKFSKYLPLIPCVRPMHPSRHGLIPRVTSYPCIISDDGMFPGFVLIIIDMMNLHL